MICPEKWNPKYSTKCWPIWLIFSLVLMTWVHRFKEKNINIFRSWENLNAFKENLHLWCRWVKRGNLSNFPSLEEMADDEVFPIPGVKKLCIIWKYYQSYLRYILKEEENWNLRSKKGTTFWKLWFDRLNHLTSLPFEENNQKWEWDFSVREGMLGKVYHLFFLKILGIKPRILKEVIKAGDGFIIENKRSLYYNSLCVFF